MFSRIELKTNAKFAFIRNYWSYVAVAFLMSLFVTGGLVSSSYVDYDEDLYELSSGAGVPMSSLIIGIVIVVVIMVLFWILVTTVLEVGGDRFFILNRTERAPISTFFSIFRCGHYGHVAGIIALRDIYLILWTLLLIVPGIVKSYEYLMVPYILAENPGMDRKEVFAISKRMMEGEKWDAFVLSLSFFGWELLSGFTCGLVGIFWVNPYENATFAELYAYNKAKAYREGYITG